MRYASPDLRRAYVEGAHAAFESSVTTMGAADKTALEEWFEALEGWIGGPPPTAPHEWLDELEATEPG